MLDRLSGLALESVGILADRFGLSFDDFDRRLVNRCRRGARGSADLRGTSLIGRAAIHARLLSGIESRAQAGRGARQIAAGSNNPPGRYPAPGVIGDGIL
jgi:hypothetical protein